MTGKLNLPNVDIFEDNGEITEYEKNELRYILAKHLSLEGEHGEKFIKKLGTILDKLNGEIDKHNIQRTGVIDYFIKKFEKKVSKASGGGRSLGKTNSKASSATISPRNSYASEGQVGYIENTATLNIGETTERIPRRLNRELMRGMNKLMGPSNLAEINSGLRGIVNKTIDSSIYDIKNNITPQELDNRGKNMIVTFLSELRNVYLSGKYQEEIDGLIDKYALQLEMYLPKKPREYHNYDLYSNFNDYYNRDNIRFVLESLSSRINDEILKESDYLFETSELRGERDIKEIVWEYQQRGIPQETLNEVKKEAMVVFGAYMYELKQESGGFGYISPKICTTTSELFQPDLQKLEQKMRN